MTLAQTALVFSLGALAVSRSAPVAPAAAEDQAGQGEVVSRLAGKAKAEPRKQDDGTTFYCSGVHRVTTPLPAGYPPPTPPGVIEVKSYPQVRRATVTGEGQGPDGMRNATTGFWPLFAHIKRRGIAMTAPVEIEYEGLSSTDDKAAEGWSMSFLYRTEDLGPKESYAGIEVADTKPMTVFAVGLAGDATREEIDKALKKLEAMIGESDKWSREGDPRIMGYNGPDVPQAERWSEVQIPVVKTDDKHDADNGNDQRNAK